MDVRWLILLLFFIPAALCEEGVLFESDKRFKVVDPSSVSADEYGDPQNTGSQLFDASADNNDKKRLSLAVMVNRFRSQSSNYFRAHPVFISCLQLVMNTLQNDDKPLMLYSGYKTKSDTSGSTSIQDMYARAGTGAVLAFRPKVTGDIKDIAKAALKFGPPLFERIGRDIGIVMMSDRVHIHMTGEVDTEPYFASEGFGMDTSAFTTWAKDAIDEGIDPVQSPDCSKYTGLDSGGVHPSGVTTAEEAVGVVDQSITRDTTNDFIKLVQYQGRNIVFTNPERTAGWCGKEGNPCIDCRRGPVGNPLSKRCANRLMSCRMYNFLRVLQKMVRTNIRSKLKVIKAYDEPREGPTDYSPTSLHAEGRKLVLELDTDNTAANLKTVTKYAQCAGVDYVKNTGTQVILAVKKMKGQTAQKINFQGTELIAVEPPEDKKSYYKLPSTFDASEEDDYPLYDPNGQGDDLLAEDTPLRLFISQDSEFRYFRLHPMIAKCYSLIQYHHNKYNEDGDPKTTLHVVRAYISTTEESLLIDSFDQRINTFPLGIAMELRYADNPQNKSLHDLLQTVIDECGPLFSEEEEQMGLGLYEDRVFVDMREEFDVWSDDIAPIPEDHGTIHVYKGEMEIRYEAALEHRIVNPDDLRKAKESANVPYMQSPDFNHKTPPHVLRRRRAAPDPDDCVPKADTTFCANTKKHREEQIEKVWKEVSRKWHYHDEKEVRAALEKCLGACGTCMEGSIYEDKLEACDNFLHWIPFGLMNENTISNFFPRDDQNLRKYASQGHTIEDAELFHSVVNSVEGVYRPDPKMSVEENLYTAAENPSPVMKVLYSLYAIHAEGVVKVWSKDDTDISSLREPLEVLMLYNKNITNVEIYVSSPGSKDAVDSAMQNLIMEWSTTGCPEITRKIIAPFSIHDLPNYVTKRDVDTSIRDKLIENHWSREERWIHQEL